MTQSKKNLGVKKVEITKQAIDFIQAEDAIILKPERSEFEEHFYFVKGERMLPFSEEDTTYCLTYKEISEFLKEEENGLCLIKCQTLFPYDYAIETFSEETLKRYEEIIINQEVYYIKNRLVGTKGFDLDILQLKTIELEPLPRTELCVEGTANEMELEDRKLIPYIGLDRSIRFKINRDVPHKKHYLSGQKITKLHFNNQIAEIQQVLRLKNVTMNSYNVQLKSRNTSQILETSGSFKEISSKITKLNKKITEYQVEIDIAKVLFEFRKLQTIDAEKGQSDDIIDAYIKIVTKELEQPVIFRLGKPRVMVNRNLKGEVFFKNQTIVYDFVPYFTIKGNNLSLCYNQYTEESFNKYKQILKGKISYKHNKPIWIVGEKPYKAQDTGYRFFKYLREKRPEIDAYYVINKQSVEYQNVKELGNVLEYKSPEHFEKMVQADFICTSHHMEHIFPNRSKEMERKIKAKRVFLQHGVLGTKNLQTYYHKKIPNFNTDLFIVSSEREKRITTTDLGYDDNQVLVTGLSRFDSLLDGSVEKKKQILLIPSWREWITDKDKLLASQYLEKMNVLLVKLNEMDLKGYQIVFCLHPNMQPFLDYFEIPKSEQITVIRQGERDVQELMKESALMITDYSSVGFDFSFLHRPVLYYQFDRHRFLGKYPSHLDLDQELPGFIDASEDKILEKMAYFIDRNCENDPEYIERSKVFFNFNDLNSCDRIFEQVTNHHFTRKETIKNKLEQEILVTGLLKKFRKSKAYFPTMKLYYKYLKNFTKRQENLVLFESNVGKVIGDNPKVIFDELINQNKDYEMIWVCNKLTGMSRFEHVKVIKRLSWQYYYYLAKAKYWVNNQNFPTYIMKPKETIYLQTWHGTPLKKMQNDIEEISGRDEGYLSRVNRAVSNWDYLVSPSHYATQAFRSAFHYQKEVLEVGYPRNDIFYQTDEWQRRVPAIRESLGLESDTRQLILYAPTFRDDTLVKGKAQFELQFDLESFYHTFSNDYVLLLKPHIINGTKVVIPEEFRDSIKNVSTKDIQDLYLVSDICITDYSSVMFDFANTKKPLLFFTYDLEHYREHLRGFYMDFEEEAPGPLCMNEAELFDAIAHIEEVGRIYQPKYDAFYHKYCGLEDGHAAEKVVTKVFN